MNWRTRLRAASAGLLMLAAAQAMAFYIPPPEPLEIRFEPGSRGLLTPAGEANVDRLAVLGAKCPDGRLRILLSHGADIAATLVDVRYREIRQRLAGLGLEAIYVNRTARKSRAAPDVVAASVASNGNEYCFGSDSALLRQWVGQLARHAARPGSKPPAFWARMAPVVRRDNLALTLANTAYCQQQEGPRLSNCEAHPEVFAWLAERVAVPGTRDRREAWLLALWSAADDTTLVDWQRKLRLGALAPQHLAWQVPILGASNLPWPVMQERLLTPGLMVEVGQQLMYRRFPAAASVIEAAVARRQIDALPRLIAAAGEQAPSFHWELILVATAVDADADAEQLLGLLPKDYVGRPGFDDMLIELLLMGAHCPGLMPGEPQRFARVWDHLLARGFRPGAETLKRVMQSSYPAEDGECRVRPLPGQPYRFERVTRA